MDGELRRRKPQSAEEIEFSYFVSSVRMMIRHTDDLDLLNKIYNGLNVAIGETVDRRYDLRRSERAKRLAK